MMQAVIKMPSGTLLYGLGLLPSALSRLAEGQLCLTQLDVSVPAGPVIIAMADSHQELVQTIQASGFEVSWVLGQWHPNNPGEVN